MSNTTALRFDGLQKSYGRQSVLRGFSLDVAAGEFFGLVGVNGAGKTTCMKVLLNFSHLDGGAIHLFDTSHTDTTARERVAYLPERFLPPYYLTGNEFFRYMGRLHGRIPAEQEINDMLAALDLDQSALNKPVRDYSKGMAQKLGLAACFLSGKDLLILDEPMSGLDPKARLLVKRYLSGLKDQGRTVFLSTHLLADVDDLCDRMGVLHEGQLRFTGSPKECLETFAAETLEQAYLHCISA